MRPIAARFAADSPRMMFRHALAATTFVFAGSVAQLSVAQVRAPDIPPPAPGPALAVPSLEAAAERGVPQTRQKARRIKLGAIQPPPRPEALSAEAPPAAGAASAQPTVTPTTTAAATAPEASEPERAETSSRRSRRAQLPPQRPSGPPETATADRQAPVEAAAQPVAAPAPPAAPSLFAALFGPKPAPAAPAEPETDSGRPFLDARIRHHARLNEVPEALVHRIVIRESRYNPRAVGRGGAMGLMQIKTATARGVGYAGGPSGLLDAETNLTYAVKYLAGAYRTARGNFDLSVRYYARGYYYAAKSQGLITTAARGRRERLQEADASAVVPQQ